MRWHRDPRYRIEEYITPDRVVLWCVRDNYSSRVAPFTTRDDAKQALDTLADGRDPYRWLDGARR